MPYHGLGILKWHYFPALYTKVLFNSKFFVMFIYFRGGGEGAETEGDRI